MKTLADNSRRSFLKKAAYTIPTIVALGALTTPAMAGGSCISPKGRNNGYGNGWQESPGNSGPHTNAYGHREHKLEKFEHRVKKDK